jgi:hypothetical protein
MQMSTARVEQLYTSLARHIAHGMAECYHPAATFRDIAFDLHGRKHIVAMWEMICTTDIQSTFEILAADSDTAIARVVDDYTFSDTGRRVHNVIESRFRFRDGLIIEHIDSCDAPKWAAMAIGGIGGFIAGRVGLVRRYRAARMLREYERRRA